MVRGAGRPSQGNGSPGRQTLRGGLAGLGRAVLAGLLILVVGLAPAWTGAARADDNPDLLPAKPTPVIDLARILTDGQREALESELNDFDHTSGWKLRVVTQYDRTPGLAVKDFWTLDERSLLLVADERGGNLLNFNVGDALFALMPRTFWVELQTRFGNQYYVREHGRDGAVLDALHTVKGCLAMGGCQVVPGLPREQWLLTLCTSILGGLIVGFAAFPRQAGRRVEWVWVLLLSPLWLILFGVFGVAPIVTRTSDLLPLVRNGLGFAAAAVGAYLIAQATVGKDRLGKGET
ncbi:MAG: TPM domain-containing protein [Cyanobacteriota bacterium]